MVAAHPPPLARRLAYVGTPVLALALVLLAGGGALQSRIEGALLGLTMGASSRAVGEGVVWLDTQAAGSEALVPALAPLAHAHLAAIVIDLPLPVTGSADLDTLASVLTAQNLVLVVPPGREPLPPRLTRLPPAPFLPEPLAGIGAAAGSLTALPGTVAVEPLGSADADGVWREAGLLGGEPRAPVPSAALATVAVAHGADPASLSYDGPGRLQLAGRAIATGPSGAILPWYGGPAGRAGGLTRLTLADLRGPSFRGTALDGRVLVVGHGAPYPTANGERPEAQALAERIEALDAGAYVVRPGWAPPARLALAAVAALCAALLVPPLTRRYGYLAAGAAALLGAGALGLTEVVLLIQGGLALPLAFAGLAWIAASLGGALASRAAVTQPEVAGSGTGTVHSHDPGQTLGRGVRAPARPAGPPPGASAGASAAKPSPPAPGRAAGRGRSDDDPYQRSGSYRAASAAPASALQSPARADAPRPPAATGAPPRGETRPRSLADIDLALRAAEDGPADVHDVADELLAGGSRTGREPRVAHYALEREIGRGAHSTVYLAHDTRDGRPVALKAIDLPDERDGGADLKVRFFRGAQNAQKLEHPGIVRVLDHGEQGALAYLAMAYSDGRALAHYASPARLLPARVVLEVGARIADALAHAHAAGVIHRDIKPANVLIDPHSYATLVTDFGIAKLSDQVQTRTGVIVGTPSFMAPEQIEGGTVTGRSDLFALGVTLFQLLTGQLPFMADSMLGLMEKIASAPHAPLQSFRPDLPACAGAILDRALEKDPERRYAGAAEMAQALRACATTMAS